MKDHLVYAQGYESVETACQFFSSCWLEAVSRVDRDAAFATAEHQHSTEHELSGEKSLARFEIEDKKQSPFHAAIWTKK